MAEVTLNKDGSPRKKGSGKTKGAGCFTKMKWSELREYVGENVAIPISRVWLRGLGVPVEEPSEEQDQEIEETKSDVLEERAYEPRTKSGDEPVLENEDLKDTEEPMVDTAEPVEETEEPVEEEDSPPLGAVTPPYRYAQDFDM